jgi:hypothetical protein
MPQPQDVTLEWQLSHTTSATIRGVFHLYFALLWGFFVFLLGVLVVASVGQLGSPLQFVVATGLIAFAGAGVLHSMSRSSEFRNTLLLRFPDTSTPDRSVLDGVSIGKLSICCLLIAYLYFFALIMTDWTLFVFIPALVVYIITYVIWWWFPHTGAYCANNRSIVIHNRETVRDGERSTIARGTDTLSWSIRGFSEEDREIDLSTVTTIRSFRFGDLGVVLLFHADGIVPSLVAVPVPEYTKLIEAVAPLVS